MDRCNYCPRYEKNKRLNAECRTCDFFSIVAPSGATNGDMIKAMFPNAKIHQSGGYTGCLFQPSVMLEDTKSDWWNAPYKAESEDKE